ALIAKEAEVYEMWLTHFSPSMSRPEEFINFAKAIFPNTKIGKDLMTTTLKNEH
ncbi:MAG: rnz, partial [Sedimentibacter sp.]|nr:rnz [Sedimentibacter sp.]